MSHLIENVERDALGEVFEVFLEDGVIVDQRSNGGVVERIWDPLQAGRHYSRNVMQDRFRPDIKIVKEERKRNYVRGGAASCTLLLRRRYDIV